MASGRRDSETFRRYVVMSVRLPSEAVYRKARLAFRLAVVVICFSTVSLCAGVFGKRYIYALVSNISPLFLLFVLYESMQQRLWGLDLLKMQCFLTTVYGLTLVIMDSIMLAFTVTNYRYCYGGWHSQCEDYQGAGDFDLLCTADSTMDSPPKLLVTCMSKETYAFHFVCLAFNLLHALGIAPYLLACHALKSAMGQSGWENGSMILFNPTPDLVTVVARSIVILGNEEEVDENEVTPGVPAFSKGRYEHNQEIREDLDCSRQSAKATARLM